MYVWPYFLWTRAAPPFNDIEFLIIFFLCDLDCFYQVFLIKYWFWIMYWFWTFLNLHNTVENRSFFELTLGIICLCSFKNLLLYPSGGDLGWFFRLLAWQNESIFLYLQIIFGPVAKLNSHSEDNNLLRNQFHQILLVLVGCFFSF